MALVVPGQGISVTQRRRGRGAKGYDVLCGFERLGVKALAFGGRMPVSREIRERMRPAGVRISP